MVGYHLDHRYHHLAMINLFSLHFHITLYGKSTVLVKRYYSVDTCDTSLNHIKMKWQFKKR